MATMVCLQGMFTVALLIIWSECLIVFVPIWPTVTC